MIRPGRVAIFLFMFAVSGTATATSVDKHQLLNEYRKFVQYAEDLPADMLSNANRRIAELQAELGEHDQPQNNRFGQSMAMFRKNIQSYSALLRNFPNKPDNDRVLYGLARAYNGVSDLQRAVSTLEKLIREYPDSDLVEEATFRRAEMLFEQFDFVGADRAYRDVIALGPESRFYAYALYKHGWSLFKQERYEGGLDSLLKALDFLIRDVETHNDVLLLSQLPADEQALFDDTLRAISLSFSYISDAMSISDRLALHSERRNEYLIYGNLADLYMKKQRYYDAAQVYQSFAQNHPDHILAPKYLILSIKAAEVGKFPSVVLEKKERFAKRFAFDTDFWKDHKQSEFPKVVSYLKKTMQELARHYHALAQISKKNKDFQQAISWYRRYINSFEGDPETAEVSYTLAEALYQNKQYDQAANQFEKVAYEYENYARSAEAGYAALLALQKSQSDQEGQPPSHAWLDKALHFSTTYPDHPESTNVLLKVAEGLYADKDWDRLIEAESALLKRKGIKPPQILTATLMLGHAHFQKEEFEKAIEFYEKALDLKPSSKKKSEIRDWLASSYYKQGEVFRRGGLLKKAGVFFGRAYKTAPKSDIAPIALYDSAKASFDLKDWPEAISRLLRFKKRFPEHHLGRNVPAMLAKSYESFGQTDKAIQAYIMLSKQAGESGVRENALWKAAELLREMGKPERAIPLYQQFIKTYSHAFELVVEAYQILIDYARESRNGPAYHELLQQLVDFEKQQPAKRTERTRQLAANAALTLSEEAITDYHKVKLSPPLQKSLPAKRVALEKAVSALNVVVTYAEAGTTTEATYRIAELYHDFADQLKDSSPPSGLSSVEQEQYRQILGSQAKPFMIQAISTHIINAERIREGVYTSAVRRSLVELFSLYPIRYGKREKLPMTPGWLKDVVPDMAGQESLGKILQWLRKGEAKRFQEALENFMQTHPGSPAKSALNLLFAIQQDQTEAAESALEKMRNSKAYPSAWVLLFTAILERRKGNFDKAENAYLQAIQEDDGLAEAHLNLGILYDLYLLDRKKALQQYQKYQSFNTSDSPPVKIWIQDIKQQLAALDKNV